MPFDDTFCFYWASMHSYVLVRVLEASIAILPIRSRLAFLYFHHHNENEIDINTILQDATNISNWKHCPCRVNDGGSRFDQHVVLTTQHTSFKLTARGYHEKMMFLNLVKFKHRIHKMKQQAVIEDVTDIPQDVILETMQKNNAIHLEKIQHHIERLERAKQCITDYMNQLNAVDTSLDLLIDSIPIVNSITSLSSVQGQLSQSVTDFHLHRKRVTHLMERVSIHNDFLEEARKKYELVKKRVKSHAWYPWSPILAVLVVLIAILYYHYH